MCDHEIVDNDGELAKKLWNYFFTNYLFYMNHKTINSKIEHTVMKSCGLMQRFRSSDQSACSIQRNERERGGSPFLSNVFEAKEAMESSERKKSEKGGQFESAWMAAFI